MRRALTIDLGDRVLRLEPGDKLTLTHTGEVNAGGTAIKASVTYKYVWDGKILKRMWTE